MHWQIAGAMAVVQMATQLKRPSDCAITCHSTSYPLLEALSVTRRTTRRHMPQLASESFDAVIDKGTLDAILCSTSGFDHVPNTLLECARCGSVDTFLRESMLQPFALLLLHARVQSLAQGVCAPSPCISPVCLCGGRPGAPYTRGKGPGIRPVRRDQAGAKYR